MLEQRTQRIDSTDETHYLVGPEGLIWVQPAFGEPVIIAANNESQRTQAARFIGELLAMGLVPYGMPLNQRVNVAMFGGSPIRDCQWVHHASAPLPVGEDGDTLPTWAAITLSSSGKERTESLQSHARQILIDTGFDVNQSADLRTLAPIMVEQTVCHTETARRHLAKAARRLRGEYVATRGGKRDGAGRPREE